ncbi:Rop family plasmid primer RNA-binding protein [Providencia rettgeri]
MNKQQKTADNMGKFIQDQSLLLLERGQFGDRKFLYVKRII